MAWVQQIDGPWGAIGSLLGSSLGNGQYNHQTAIQTDKTMSLLKSIMGVATPQASSSSPTLTGPGGYFDSLFPKIVPSTTPSISDPSSLNITGSNTNSGSLQNPMTVTSGLNYPTSMLAQLLGNKTTANPLTNPVSLR